MKPQPKTYTPPTSRALAISILAKLAAEKRRIEGQKEMDRAEEKRLARLREIRNLIK